MLRARQRLENFRGHGFCIGASGVPRRPGGQGTICAVVQRPYQRFWPVTVGMLCALEQRLCQRFDVPRAGMRLAPEQMACQLNKRTGSGMIRAPEQWPCRVPKKKRPSARDHGASGVPTFGAYRTGHAACTGAMAVPLHKIKSATCRD